MSQKEYTFREGNECDFGAIADLLEHHHFGMTKAHWFTWKYLENPYGTGRIFVVETREKEVIGVLGYIPHLLSDADGVPLLVMACSDGFLAPEARGQDVFRDLLRFSCDLISEPKIGFPNKLSEKGLMKADWSVLAPTERWYFPVMSSPFSQKSKLRSALQAVCQGFARAYARIWLPSSDGPVTMRPVDTFQHDFKQLTPSPAGARTAAFLNWRFMRSPMREYVGFEFCRNQTPLGYCVLHIEQKAAIIYDFCTSNLERHCLRKIFDYCVDNGVARLFYQGHGLKLWKFGFVKLTPKNRILHIDLPERPWVIRLSDSDW